MLDKFGYNFRQIIRFNTELFGLLIITLKQTKNLKKLSRRRIFLFLFERQLYNSGLKATYINTIIAVLVGWVIMSRAYIALPHSANLAEYYSKFFVIIVVRELGPLISGFILISRSASAITAEIGHLRLLNEFDVLDSMRMNSVFVFALPVFYAFPISLLLMFFYFNCVCTISSYFFINQVYGTNISFHTFLVSILQQISTKEVIISVTKAMVGGSFIGLVSILYGARVHERYTDISRAISNSTTTQLFGFFTLNILLSILAYR